MAAISKVWVTIADAAVDPDSPVDATLMTGIRDNQIHLREWLGASFVAGAVQDHNHDGANSALIDVGPNLLRNGSFEDDGAGWTITDYSGGSHAFSTSTRHHGAQSLAFTSTSTVNGGGDAVNNNFIPVGGGETLQWEALLSASVANISSRVEMIWYDAAQSQISAVNLLDLTNTPTSLAVRMGSVRAPSTARFAKLKLIGGVPGAGSATGTIFFDGVALKGSGLLVLIEEQVASASATIDFVNGINDTFNEYVLKWKYVKPASAGTSLRMRASTDGGSVYDSAANYIFGGRGRDGNGTDTSDGSGAAPDDSFILAGSVNGLTTTAGEYCHGSIRIVDPSVSETYKSFRWEAWWDNGVNDKTFIDGAAWWTVPSGPGDLNAMRFFMATGNIAEGVFRLYGVRK